MLAAPGAGAVGLFKTASVAEVSPGDAFTYNFVASCSGLEQSCINAVLTDPVPLGLEVVRIPPSTDQYDVSLSGAFPGQQTLVVAFKIPLVAPNPPGSVGLPDGSALNLTLGVRLPPESQVRDGTAISNTGEMTADGSDPAPSTAAVDVVVPKIVTPVATKSWADGSAVAGTGEASTITLGVRNASSSSADVRSLGIEDTSPVVFDKFDLTGLGAVTFPAGADRVVVAACQQPASACTSDADFVASAPQAGPIVSLPISAAGVTGVRFVFSNSAGLRLPYDPTGGTVEVRMALRDTLRSGGPYNPTVTDTVTNCARPSAVEAALGDTGGDQACTNYIVYPAQAKIDVSKAFFSDTNGNYAADGRTVVGQASPASAVTTARNTSPFALSAMTITEPSATSPSELNKLDVTSIRATFPSGATSAEVSIDCGGGPVTTTLAATGDVAVPDPCSAVQRIVVAYAGVDADGNGTIAQNAAASLGVTGTLNANADSSDVNKGPGASGDGVANCADATAASSINGVGSAAGTGCATLDLWTAYSDVQGVKSAQLPTVLPGLPRLFTLSFTNSGTITAQNVVMADPADPTATTNAFDNTRLADLTLPATPPAYAEVWDPTVAAYVPYVATDEALLARAKGLRVTVPALAPGATYTLRFNVLLRDGIDEGVVFANCAGITTSSQTSNPFCSQDITVGAPRSGASLQKSLVPAQSVRPQPGLPGSVVQVKLALQNTGTLFLKQLVATDADPAFYDAVNLTGTVRVNFPPGADRVRIDVCTGACGTADWTLGTVTGSTTPPLPAGVATNDIRGVRVVFTAVPVSTPTYPDGDAYRIRPGTNFPSSGPCTDASACISFVPRIDLRSAPDTPVPDTLTDIAAGGYESRAQDPDMLASIPPTSATHTLTAGTAQLRFSKSPNATVVPGASIPFILRMDNPGTGAIPDPTVVDPIPAELEYAPLDAGTPYEITYTLPAGAPAPPQVEFSLTNDATTGKTTGLRWDFPGWDLVPGAVVRIQFRSVLAPGAVAGQTITNTGGAAGARPDATCNLNGVPNGNEAIDDPAFGPGRYCLSSANLQTGEGNAFRTQKWVAGDPALGFLNTATGAIVGLNDPACPQLDLDGRTFTRYPCVARVLPGHSFDFYLQLTNSGTNPATEVRVIDVFPHPGDTGVLLTGTARGTAWNAAPTLLSPVTLTGKGAATIDYTSAPSPVCTTDLNAPPVACDAGAFPSTTGPASSTAFRAVIQFDPTDRLQPGQTTGLRFAMAAPPDPADATNDVAWNSFAHTEFFQSGASVAQLPPTEPIKVGVAIVYGGLRITKSVNDPSGNSDNLLFSINYECAVTPAGAVDPVVVASGTVKLAGGEHSDVEHLPAGATCSIWETDSHGLISNAPNREQALSIVIPIDASIETATIDIVNTAQITTTTTPEATTTTTAEATTTTTHEATTTTTPGTTTTTTSIVPGGQLPSTGTDALRGLTLALIATGSGVLLSAIVRRRRSGGS